MRIPSNTEDPSGRQKSGINELWSWAIVRRPLAVAVSVRATSLCGYIRAAVDALNALCMVLFARTLHRERGAGMARSASRPHPPSPNPL